MSDQTKCPHYGVHPFHASSVLLPCPFCGSNPVTSTDAQRQIYSVECPKCVSIGFHNYFRFGCMADAQWNERIQTFTKEVEGKVL